MATGLPTPPTDSEPKLSGSLRRASKGAKLSSRASKRTSVSLAHEHGGLVMDGRHKRVWKACERCRMKKTKCDGESPCRRCKDDGLVCTAGSRKKTEYKQLPRGYAEVLENTQYALIATVQKLYTMLRNGESWDLGEPEINDRGLPVIHNIAEKLGCIRPSPDMPYVFPEDADQFAELQAQLKLESGDEVDGTPSMDLGSLPRSVRMDRASSSDSDHSTLSTEYSQLPWDMQQQQQAQSQLPGLQSSGNQELNFGEIPLYQTEFTQERANMAKNLNAFNLRRASSPGYSELQNSSSEQSPVFRNDSPFSSWSSGDDFLGTPNILDLTSLYMRQQQQQQLAYQRAAGLPRSMPGSMDATALLQCGGGSLVSPGAFMSMADGTIRPNMLDCDGGYDLVDQMDNIMFPDYESQVLSIN